jgi:hypothetical protein
MMATGKPLLKELIQSDEKCKHELKYKILNKSGKNNLCANL